VSYNLEDWGARWVSCSGRGLGNLEFLRCVEDRISRGNAALARREAALAACREDARGALEFAERRTREAAQEVAAERGGTLAAQLNRVAEVRKALLDVHDRAFGEIWSGTNLLSQAFDPTLSAQAAAARVIRTDGQWSAFATPPAQGAVDAQRAANRTREAAYRADIEAARAAFSQRQAGIAAERRQRQAEAEEDARQASEDRWRRTMRSLDAARSAFTPAPTFQPPASGAVPAPRRAWSGPCGAGNSRTIGRVADVAC
jgi:hypothetical protein